MFENLVRKLKFIIILKIAKNKKQKSIVRRKVDPKIAKF